MKTPEVVISDMDAEHLEAVMELQTITVSDNEPPIHHHLQKGYALEIEMLPPEPTNEPEVLRELQKDLG